MFSISYESLVYGVLKDIAYPCIKPYDESVGVNFLSKKGYDYRIYLNAPNSADRIKFFEIYIKKCIERGIPWTIKPDSSPKTKDKVVIYVMDQFFDETIEVLEEIKEENPELIDLFGSPIPTGVNYSYYAITHNGGPTRNATYNKWVDHKIKMAFYYAISNQMISNSEFYDSLTEEEKALVNATANVDSYKEGLTFGVFGRPLSSDESLKKYEQILKKYCAMYNVETPEFVAEFEDAFLKFCSYSIFGDFDHINGEFTLPKEFFEGMGMEMQGKESTPKPSTPEPAEETSRPKTTSTKSTSTGITREQHKNVVQNIDDAMMKVIQEYMSNFDKDPAGATETFLTKMAALKKQYLVSASAIGETNTPKFMYIINMFRIFDEFSMFKEDPTKGSGINLVNRKRHYREMAGAVKGRAQTIGMALANFDAAEDREAKEEKPEVKPKTDEKEQRRQLVENIGTIILGLFDEFLENYDRDPAGATAEFLTKLDKLKREYMVAASLMDGEKKSKRYTRAMHIFNKFEAYGVYKPESAKVDENTYYTTIAPHVKGETISLKNAVIRLDDFDVKD